MAFSTSTSMFFLLLLPLSAIARTTNGRVAVDASLTAAKNPSSWLSPSRDFAFGFHRADNKDAFLLSIWFDKIPAKTVVWWAVYQDGKPVLVPSGSKVTLTAKNGLVLTDPRGAELWKSVITMQTVDHGVVYDTGNFAIENRNSDKLWESFDFPTDTLLPTQIMMIHGQLFSRKKEGNFVQGKFRLRLSESGNLELISVSLPTKRVYDETYYSSGTSDTANQTNSGYRLVFNESGDVYVLRRNEKRSLIATAGATLPTPSSEFYQRVTLDFDGVFAEYSYPKKTTASGRWSLVWSQPDNICSRVAKIGSGACGLNNICYLSEDKRPICECPPGFSLLDPNDSYGSCKRDDELVCDEQFSAEDVYDIEVLEGTNFIYNDYERNDAAPNYDLQLCKTDCLKDCMCAVAVYDDLGCWKKGLPLSNGRYNNMDKSTFTLIKVRKDGRPPSPTSPALPKADDDKKKQTFNITVSILLGASFFVNVALIAAFCFTVFFVYKKKHSNSKGNDQRHFQTNLRFFNYKELLEATNGFQEELGRGAFGVVYKGTMQMAGSSSRTNIAVKKLDGILLQDGEKEFKAEINVIGKTHHKNLVRLLGACEEREQRLLVYEFLSNGTLADYLFRNIKPSWNQRTQIALGIARGLLYLHEECSTQIIHCDIKPRNILLDDYCNARISDFGLAKLLMMDQTQTKTNIRGTKGYVAPEWFRRNMPVTVKVDVYSFGVMLLEIICCRRSVVDEEMGDGENTILTYWAYDCFERGTIEDLVRDDMEAINDMRSLEKFLMIAFWCIQEDPYLRPTMRKVTQMLEGVIPVTIPPNPSPFSIVE